MLREQPALVMKDSTNYLIQQIVKVVHSVSRCTCNDKHLIMLDLTFLLMDDATSMSLERTLMALTHSILINLFIKLELYNFLLPPLLSIVLSKSV